MSVLPLVCERNTFPFHSSNGRFMSQIWRGWCLKTFLCRCRTPAPSLIPNKWRCYAVSMALPVLTPAIYTMLLFRNGPST